MSYVNATHGGGIKMNREDIPTRFLNKKIKLITDTNFILSGKIVEINETNIIFETKTAESVIALRDIKEIVLKKPNNNLRDTCIFEESCTKKSCETDVTVCGDYERK